VLACVDFTASHRKKFRTTHFIDSTVAGVRPMRRVTDELASALRLHHLHECAPARSASDRVTKAKHARVARIERRRNRVPVPGARGRNTLRAQSLTMKADLIIWAATVGGGRQ